MPSGSNLPTSLATLLATFQSVFTAPTFTTFCAMVSGFLAQTGEHNVCGMLSGAGLAQRWHHSRAHHFFLNSSWQINELGLRLATVIIDTLIERDAAIKQGGNPTFTSMFPSAFPLHCDVDTRLFSPANTAITRFHQRIDAIGKQPKGDDTQQHRIRCLSTVLSGRPDLASA